MKTSTIETKTDKFPYIGEYNGPQRDTEGSYLVLFTSYRVGTVIHTKNPALKLGEHYSNFGSEEFIPFNGKLILEN